MVLPTKSTSSKKSRTSYSDRRAARKPKNVNPTKIASSDPKAALRAMKVKNKVYHAKPSKTLAKSLAAYRCGVKSFKSNVDATMTMAAFPDYAAAIVDLANDEVGIIPEGSGTWNPGCVTIYLEQCLLGYLWKCGVQAAGDALGVAASYVKYYVPTSIAVLFQNCAPWVSSDEVFSFTKVFTNFTAQIVNANSYLQGGGQCPVSTGVDAAFSNEYTFGVGASVTSGSASYDPDEISDVIRSACEVVLVADIANFASTAEAVVSVTNSYIMQSVTPLPGVVGSLSLFSVSEPLDPHVTHLPLSQIDGTVQSSAYCLLDYRRWWVSKMRGVRYSPNLSVTRCFKLKQNDPWKLAISIYQQNFSKFCGLATAFMDSIGGLNSWTASDAGRLISWLNYAYGAILARTAFVSRTHNVADNIPAFKTKLLEQALLPPSLGSVGYLPTRCYNTIIYPLWGSATTSLAVLYQPTTGVIATDSKSVGSTNWTTTIPASTLFGGLAMPAGSTKFNIVPLRMNEEMLKVIKASLSAFALQTIPYRNSSEWCPCHVEYNWGGSPNNNTVGGGSLVLTLPASDDFSCSRAVSGMDCIKNYGCGFSDFVPITLYYQSTHAAANNPYSQVIDAGLVSSTPAGMNAAMGKGGLVASMNKYFDNNLANQLTTEVINVTGDLLLKEAKRYIAEGSPIPLSVGGEELVGMITGTEPVSLENVLIAAAAAMGGLTVAAIKVIRGIRFPVYVQSFIA